MYSHIINQHSPKNKVGYILFRLPKRILKVYFIYSFLIIFCWISYSNLGKMISIENKLDEEVKRISLQTSKFLKYTKTI